MTFRCTVENGRIVLPPDAGLPNGTEVDVQPVRTSKKLKTPHPAFGIWKNRKDLGKDPVKTLRARSRRRRTGK